jgi:dolichol-phosphate mannosyltransferase/undecaprenyl-phosphate 4-deoxy-4-formamido-L-arabinose transferase
MSLVSAGLGGFVIAKKLLWGVGVAGWTSLVVIVLMTAGLVLFSLGVIGEYLIRIINGIEAKQAYVVRTKTRSRR